MDKSEMEIILSYTYQLVVKTRLKYKSRDKKGEPFEIESRTKIKNLSMALRHFENPKASFLHFIKYACYFLPRSKMHKRNNDFLGPLLDAIQTIENNAKEDSDYSHEVELLDYLIGYTTWTLDALVAIFNTEKEKDVEKAVRKMVETEYKIIGKEVPESIITSIMNWYKKAKNTKQWR